MSKINETSNSAKESLESLQLETVSFGQKSDVLSQVTADRQTVTACLKEVNKKHLTTQRIAPLNVRTPYQKINLERDARNATPGN